MAKSLFKSLADLVIFFITENRDVSSANNFGLDAKSSDKPLMYIIKNNGPSIEPYGTPASVAAHFFSIWVFFHDHSQITGLQGKGEGISLTPRYYFHPLYRHLDIIRAISAESSLLHIASSQTGTGNLWFPSTSR